MKNRIKKAMAELGIEKKDMYTAKELDAIAKTAKVSMFDVMYFLRDGK